MLKTSPLSLSTILVLVGNKHDKRTTTVQFYNDAQQLIYEETITGKNLIFKKKNQAPSCRRIKQGVGGVGSEERDPVTRTGLL